MKPVSNIRCPVCQSPHRAPFVSTNAMMHKRNEERYRFDQCGHCHSVFLVNPVQESHLAHYYTENYLPYRGPEAWGKFQAFVERSQQRLDKKRARLVSRMAQNKKSFSILDVGCGNPSFLNAVQQKTNADCTGIDFSDEGWKDDNYPSLKLVKSSFDSFQPAQLFDVITLWHYLEHDYNLQRTADKLYESLRTGGKLIIEVPDYQSLTAKVQSEHWQGWHSPRHITLFSKKGFQSLFPEEKWTIRKHWRHGTLDAFTLWWLGKMEKKQIDWSGTMEGEFWPLVFSKVVGFPVFAFEKVVPMGIQLLVIEKNG
jgi:predicted SAM-dependent methyltransferase